MSVKLYNFDFQVQLQIARCYFVGIFMKTVLFEDINTDFQYSKVMFDCFQSPTPGGGIFKDQTAEHMIVDDVRPAVENDVGHVEQTVAKEKAAGSSVPVLAAPSVQPLSMQVACPI